MKTDGKDSILQAWDRDLHDIPSRGIEHFESEVTEFREALGGCAQARLSARVHESQEVVDAAIECGDVIFTAIKALQLFCPQLTLEDILRINHAKCSAPYHERHAAANHVARRQLFEMKSEVCNEA